MSSKFTGEHACRSVASISLQSNFIEITLQHGCSTVNLLHIFRTLLPKSTSGGLLLDWIFLGISKAIDRVWYEGLIYKLQSSGIFCLPMKCIENFLTNRFQRVLLNGQSSSWSPVLAGVP